MSKLQHRSKLLLKTALAASLSTILPDALAQTSVAIEEIIVTARKKSESLQEISAAVTAISGDRLKESVINDVRDLQTLVPSLNVGEAVGIMKINMRGLGNSTTARGEDSEVVLHVDGAVISRMEAQALAFFDLERLEVLRGPQGTLYGRNSTAGTVNLITAKPTDTFEGYISSTVGNYDLLKFDGAVSGPLSDSVKGRLAFQTIDRSGYSKNIVNGDDFNDDHRYGVRGHLQFDLSEDVQLLLTGEYANQDDASGHLTFLDTLTGAPPADPSIYSDPDSRDGSLSTKPEMKRETLSLTATFDWEINEAFALKNIVNYRELDFFNWADLDLSTANAVNVGIPFDDEQISNEIQLIYQDDKLNGMLGLYYYKETFDGSTDVWIGGSTLFQLVGNSETEALSPFWNASYDLTDKLTLRAGGRLNHEDRSIENSSGIGVLVPSPIATDERTFNEYTGEYGVDYSLTEDVMVYYTFSQGYRSGAAMVFQGNSPIIDPTTVDNHEVGLKSQFADGRFTANLALFDATVNDLQRTQARLNDAGLLDGRVNNISEMTVRGIEAEFNWVPVDQFRLDATVVYIEAEFQDFITDDPFDGVLLEIQVAGNTPRQTPELKGNIHGEYEFYLSSGDTVTANLDVSYIGEQYFDEFNRAPLEEDAYTLVDASIVYRPASDTWSLALWGKNLTDEKKLYDANFSAFGGVKNKFLTNPTTWGLTATYNF